MSQTVQWPAVKDTSTRKQTDGSHAKGSGANKRLYVGRHSGYDYWSYINFTLDWTNVGQIVSAIATFYTDDGLGTEGDFVSPSDTPTVTFRRLTAAVDEKTRSANFDPDDYVAPASTGTHAVTKVMARDPLGVTNVDITSMIEDIAPVTVKKRDGTPGTAWTFRGLKLQADTSASHNWAGVSREPEGSLSAYLPYITLTFEYGLTAPDVPTNLTPDGSIAAFTAFEGDFTDIKVTDTLYSSMVEVYDSGASATAAVTDIITSAAHGLSDGDIIYFTALDAGVGLSTFTRYYVRDATTNTFKVSLTLGGTAVNITTLYAAMTWSRLLYSGTILASDADRLAAHFSHTPSDWVPLANIAYRWRGRVYDQEGKVSAYTALTSFVVTNTAPDAPTLTPTSGFSTDSLDPVDFAGTFTDADVGDTILAYQVQLSAYPEGDAHWNDDAFILWNTGKKLSPNGAVDFAIPYGGAALAAGTYYWRARVWDNHNEPSVYSYATIILTANFVVEAQDSTNVIQLRPRAPWRIIIRGMNVDGLRGPGDIVAVLEDATNVGASVLYNSPGEAHWTLGHDHPQISVIEPKQTHYAIEFRQGDGWREVYAGLVDDIDASERDVIFYGKDYLALLDANVDEHYDPANPDLPAEKGGSKYVTSTKNTIGYIVRDQLVRAIATPNSPLGFMTINQSSATLAALFPETITAFSTYAPTLNFIVGLLNSHRAGTGKRSRLSVRKKTAGGYEFYFADDPGVVRDNLSLQYGELVQGYRVLPFGPNWATRVAGFGRDKDGVLVRYKAVSAPGIDEAVWGRWVRPAFFDGVADANDLTRKVTQAAVQGAKLGGGLGLGLRSGVLQPRDGYDVCDAFPVDILDAPIDTDAFGSGYWNVVGITWTALQQGDLNTILSFAPREDSAAPDSDLLTLSPISTQPEWQIGYTAPSLVAASSRYWLDQTTGKVYIRSAGDTIAEGITGT